MKLSKILILLAIAMFMALVARMWLKGHLNSVRMVSVYSGLRHIHKAHSQYINTHGIPPSTIGDLSVKDRYIRDPYTGEYFQMTFMHKTNRDKVYVVAEQIESVCVSFYPLGRRARLILYSDGIILDASSEKGPEGFN